MNMLIFIIRNKKIWDLDASVVYQNVIHIKHKKMSHETYKNPQNNLKEHTDFFKYHFNTHNWK